jgi:hypothetical protein
MSSHFSLRRTLTAAPLWALAGILLSAASSRAQDPPGPRHHLENRFLFVIDTSSGMKSRTNGIEEAVMGLLTSDMHGELRKGDTIGVWTYNDRLDTDFPRQVWSEQKKDDIVSKVRAHLHGLRYENRSHLEKVVPQLKMVVAVSERLTVILVFDGADLNKCTPFDNDINDLERHYAREFKAAHAPFVTLLAVRNGAVFDYTINYPRTVVVPHMADPLAPPVTNAPPALAVSQPPPPVIVSPPVELPPQHRIEITLSGSNFAHNANAPPPAPSNVVAVVQPEPAVAPAAVVPAAVVPPAVVPPVESNQPPPVAAAPAVVQAADTNIATPAPAPPTAAASSPPAEPVVAATATPLPVAPPPAPATVVPAAPAVVAATTGAQVAMFVMAFSLLTIAVVLVVFLVRRSRGTPPSLISQSIDRSR